MKFENSSYLCYYSTQSNVQQTEEVQHIRSSTGSDIPRTSMDVMEPPATSEFIIVETQSENNIPLWKKKISVQFSVKKAQK